MNLKLNAGALLMILVAPLAFGKEVTFTLTPKGELPTTIAPQGTKTLSYTVTNVSETAYQDIGLSFAPTGHTPAGVSQISSVGNCSDPFDLKPGESCNLFLLVKADELEQGRAIGGPEICSASSPPVRCSIPKEGDELNIVVGNAPLPSSSAPE